MFEHSRISISWNFEPERRLLRALLDFCFGRIGLNRTQGLETLPDNLRRDVGLMPHEAELPQRDARW